MSMTPTEVELSLTQIELVEIMERMTTVIGNLLSTVDKHSTALDELRDDLHEGLRARV